MFKIAITILLASIGAKAEVRLSIYHQAVHLGNSNNVIQQSIFRATSQKNDYDLYLGFYSDFDQQSNETITFTDQQFSPLAGIQSKTKFFSKLFLEFRDVNRIGSFSDNRPQQDNELRFGLLGYNYNSYKNLIFSEWYYNTFYSQLYDKKFIFQAWHKQGISKSYFSVFNEILVDSFDLTKQEQITVDARPGIRLTFAQKSYSIQLLVQYLIPLDHSGRDKETRSSLVLYGEY